MGANSRILREEFGEGPEKPRVVERAPKVDLSKLPIIDEKLDLLFPLNGKGVSIRYEAALREEAEMMECVFMTDGIGKEKIFGPVLTSYEDYLRQVVEERNASFDEARTGTGLHETSGTETAHIGIGTRHLIDMVTGKKSATMAFITDSKKRIERAAAAERRTGKGKKNKGVKDLEESSLPVYLKLPAERAVERFAKSPIVKEINSALAELRAFAGEKADTTVDRWTGWNETKKRLFRLIKEEE